MAEQKKIVLTIHRNLILLKHSGMGNQKQNWLILSQVYKQFMT